MMRLPLLIMTFFLLVTGLPSYAQERLPDVSIQLEKLFNRLRGDFSSEKKLEINDSIRTIIAGYVSSDTIFSHRFNNLRYLGQITSPDSLLKIITWNLIPGNGDNSYFLYFIRKPVRNGENRVYTLTCSYSEKPVRNDTIYSPSDWYGALYYDTRPFIFKGKPCYVLLGIDYGNSFVTRKIIDVLSFGQDGKPEFGLNCFSDGKNLTDRVVFEYSVRVVMSLKFEADNLIVFDHLSPVSPEFEGNHQFYGPDFSFDSYKFEKGLWRFNGDIDIKNKK
jgi:hypothetical protein